ncbi:MAG: glycosyltransferase family 2 protein [Anaerolineales bacterium]|jgi:GT2 family glycosyltransferase|nr:glycosyltransferase family 2 protein [Anaerolineales bacterium]
MTTQPSPTLNEGLKTLSIVIVNWNTRELLKKCLASIYSYPPPGSFEIWVVDNASSDGSVEMVKKDFPEVNLIENRHNPGFAGANNQAIRQSHAEFVLLLNPDTEVLPEALKTMVAFMRASPKVGASGSRVLNPDKTLQTSCYPFPTLFREFWRLFHFDVLWPYGVYDMHTWPTNTPRKTDVLLGAFILVRKEVIDQIGLMSEDYFMYTEEVDWCYRIKKNNWENYWVPTAQIIHYGGQSTSQVSRQMFIHLYKSKVLYFKKHYGSLSAGVYKIILLMAALLRLALSPFAILFDSPSRKEHLELAHNYRQLVKVLFSQ